MHFTDIVSHISKVAGHTDRRGCSTEIRSTSANPWAAAMWLCRSGAKPCGVGISAGSSSGRPPPPPPCSEHQNKTGKILDRNARAYVLVTVEISSCWRLASVAMYLDVHRACIHHALTLRPRAFGANAAAAEPNFGSDSEHIVPTASRPMVLASPEAMIS